MVPFVVLLIAFLIFAAAGLFGVSFFADVYASLRAAMAVMFLVTASAHWGRRRPDLIRMVPPVFPSPNALVTLTGVLEILGAIGLVFHSTSRIAAVCLAVLLVALFPANVYGAQHHLSIGGRPVPPMRIRLPLQLLFLACLIAIALH